MSIKRALEEFYEGVKLPEGLEYKVIAKVERERRKRWRRLLLVESLALLLISTLLLHTYFGSREYKVMGAEESMAVEVVKDASLIELSKTLSEYNLRIEGPYNGRFYLKGNPEGLKKFLKENRDLFRVAD